MNYRLSNYYLFSVATLFEIAKLHIPFSRHVIVEMEINKKKTYGEGVIYKTSLSFVEKLLMRLVGENWSKGKWRKTVADLIPQEPGLAGAIDQASTQLASNKKSIVYTKQIFIKPISKMLIEINYLVATGCREIKLKLGRNLKHDLELISILRERYPQIGFKADVNCGYSSAQFEKLLERSAGFIKIWEEPVEKKYQPDLVNIKQKYKIKIMLDESVQSLGSLKQYDSAGIIDVLNIKLSRVGGITAAMKYIDYCQKNNLGVSIGCSEELGVGMGTIDYLVKIAQYVVGVEGVGSERLGFDIIDDKNNFSLSRLQQAAKLLRFSIFSKNAKMSIFDKLQMFYGSKCATFKNACLFGQRLFSR